ncbi:MmcQ/YjbR family DNA-binding protein [Arthrobacter sp.]|uniref:MmcQ/YjbR family DNA-binding protein n=1 Tax=Arthrobacter sp. TaxID=1667 RepID=UPI0028977508|nr:MmcQ/YjbR family DNA-binding protein [Arthrobacter sp.]
MEGQELQDAAREAAEELPGSTMGHPFGPEYEVFKVRGKVFMLLTEVPGEPVVVLKTEPEESQALRQAHRDIKPGYHMNKKHWIMLEPAEADGEDRIRNGGRGHPGPGSGPGAGHRVVPSGCCRTPARRAAGRPQHLRKTAAGFRMSLDGRKLQGTARRKADALPLVSNGRPFTEALDVYKVSGKVFLIVTDDPAELIITVKAEPDRGRFLRREYGPITPGRYLHKDHWVSIGAGAGITDELVADLVESSYQLVCETLPKKTGPTR